MTSKPDPYDDSVDEQRSVWRKLQEAVETYEESTDTPQHRLWEAWVSHLASLDDRDFAADLVDRWNILTTLISLEPAHGEEGTLAATINKMTTDEVTEIMDIVINLRDQLADRLPPHQT